MLNNVANNEHKHNYFREYKVQSLDLIKDFEHNSRTHSEDQINEVVNSINRYGYTNPILVDENNVIIAGHCRVIAAKRCGLNEIPTIIIDGLSDVEKSELVIADNKLALNAGWDFNILADQITFIRDNGGSVDATGFKPDELTFMADEVPAFLGDEDDVPEPPADPITKRGDLWILGNHRLLCGDSTMIDNVEKLMNGDKADLLVTDPPYGVSYSTKNDFLNAYDKGNRNQTAIENDSHSPKEMNEFWLSMLKNLFIILSDKSSYYIFSPQGGDLMMMMMAIGDAGFALKHMLIWVKNNHVLGRCDYNYKHEPILYGWKATGTHKFYGNGKFKTSVWEIDKPLKNDLHPTMKPVEIIEECILNSSEKNQNVIDVFGGSGTTLIACEKTNRRCFMMELSERYCDVIVARWEKLTGKKAVLESANDA